MWSCRIKISSRESSDYHESFSREDASKLINLNYLRALLSETHFVVDRYLNPDSAHA